MPGSQSITRPQTFNFDLADASLTGYASNVTGATWALTANVASDGLAHQISIRNDSANDKSSIDIVVVGLDADGNAQSETITGPVGSATVESVGYYSYVTSVTPAATWGADTADIGWVDEIASKILPINFLSEAIVALNADVTGTINYTLQQTFDEYTSLAFTAPSQQVQWITVAASKTADGIYNTVGGALGARLLVNSYSSGAEIQLNVNPTYIANQPDGGGTGPDVDATIVGPFGQTTMSASVPVAIASDQTWTGATNLGKAEDAAHTTGDVGVMALGVRKDTAAAFGADNDYIPFRTDQYGDTAALIVDSTGAAISYNANGLAPRANSAPVVIADINAGEYETVAAGQTDQVLGPTGAVGDYLSGLLVIPATTSPGGVSIEDGATNIVVFTGGASSVSNLVPFFVPLGIYSVSGGWEVTTGSNVSVIGIGNFT